MSGTMQVTEVQSATYVIGWKRSEIRRVIAGFRSPASPGLQKKMQPWGNYPFATGSLERESIAPHTDQSLREQGDQQFFVYPAENCGRPVWLTDPVGLGSLIA